MRTINAITEYGIKPVRTIGAKREIRGENWIVAEVPTKYMNHPDPLMMRRIIHYNTGANLPVRGAMMNESAKSYLNEAEKFLIAIDSDAISKEISKYPIIN